GQQPVLWKLWMTPFSIVLVYSLHSLFRRFARRHALPLLWMTVLSPALLPGFNLMSDIPALSLSLFALTVFFRADDRDSLALGIAAGLIAGFAMQTKYTAFTIPAVMLLHSTLLRRMRVGLAASAVAVGMFVAWECLVFMVQGS